MILTIDPGANTGWALSGFEGRLFDFGRIRSREDADKTCRTIRDFGVLDRLIIEKPQVYGSGRVRPNDLITLALIAGAWGEAFRRLGPTSLEPEFICPREWKEQTPKDVSNARTFAAMTPSERGQFLDAGWSSPADKKRGARKSDDVLDAIGINLWATRRTDKAGNVLARPPL